MALSIHRSTPGAPLTHTTVYTVHTCRLYHCKLPLGLRPPTPESYIFYHYVVLYRSINNGGCKMLYEVISLIDSARGVNSVCSELLVCCLA